MLVPIDKVLSSNLVGVIDKAVVMGPEVEFADVFSALVIWVADDECSECWNRVVLIGMRVDGLTVKKSIWMG